MAALSAGFLRTSGKVRLFFQDEASFGRISEPSYCWSPQGIRPIVPAQRVREFRNVFAAAEPMTGDFFYMIEPPPPKPPPKKRGRRKKYARKPKPFKSPPGERSRFFNLFMQCLVDKYPDDEIVLVCDRAWWHNCQYTVVPERVHIVQIPPATPELNPIEQVWKEGRTVGFKNKLFDTILEVEDNIHTTFTGLKPETIMSIMQRDWVVECFQT